MAKIKAKKGTIITIIYLSIVGTLCATVIFLFLFPKTRGWFMQNDHIDNDSELIYAINQGLGDNLVSLNNLSRIYQTSDETVTTVMFVPGDQVYYTFIFKIDANDYAVNKSTYDVSLVIRAEATENAHEDDGRYLDFLHDCTIEEDSILFSVLQRGTANIDGNDVVYYDVVKYSEDNGTYVMDAEGDISAFNSETTGAEATNESVPSLCPNKTVGSIAADFEIDIPIVEINEDLIYTDENDDSYLFFMLYIPILYIDTGVNQNPQMDNRLTINGSTIFLKQD